MTVKTETQEQDFRVVPCGCDEGGRCEHRGVAVVYPWAPDDLLAEFRSSLLGSLLSDPSWR